MPLQGGLEGDSIGVTIESVCKFAQEIWVCFTIRIDEQDSGRLCLGNSPVSCSGDSQMRLANDANREGVRMTRQFGRDFLTAAVIDNDYFKKRWRLLTIE